MGQFYSFTFGMDIFSRNFIFGDILFPLFIKYNDPNLAIKDTCAMQWYM